MTTIIAFIIIFTLEILIVVGEFLFYKKIKELIKIKEYKEEEYHQIESFTPYVVLTTAPVAIKNQGGEDTGATLSAGFHTIIYEKNGLCELFSGEGYVLKEDVSSEFKRDFTPFAARMTEMAEVKNGPSQGFHTIDTLNYGEVVEAYENYGNWRRIKSKRTEGFVLESLIEKVKKT